MYSMHALCEYIQYIKAWSCWLLPKTGPSSLINYLGARFYILLRTWLFTRKLTPIQTFFLFISNLCCSFHIGDAFWLFLCNRGVLHCTDLFEISICADRFESSNQQSSALTASNQSSWATSTVSFLSTSTDPLYSAFIRTHMKVSSGFKKEFNPFL